MTDHDGNPETSPDSPARAARRLVRAADRGVLSTTLVRQAQAGWPYGSLVLLATDHDLSPVLLLSDLADHTKNLKADDRVSLLIDGTAGLAEPLTGARVSLVGRITGADGDERARRRYLARHPSAAMFAGFGDFHVYRVTPVAAHLVAGFGRIHWIDGADLAGPATPDALVEREADIVQHMNDDHADAIDAYAAGLLGLPGTGWRMTGLDAEGCDLRLEGRVARLDFAKPVADADAARVELIRLVRQARAAMGEQSDRNDR